MPKMKKYRQTREDRRHESEGMKAYYGKGHGNFANLPSEPEMRAYPKDYQDLKTDYPDTLPQIDRDARDNYEKVARYPSDSMY